MPPDDARLRPARRARIPDERIPLLGRLVHDRTDAVTAQLSGVLPDWRR